MSFDVYLVGQGVALLVALAAAIWDVKRGVIPNALTLPALALAVVGYGAAGGLDAVGLAIGGALSTALLPFLLQRAGAMGGGDVKALAAIGALLGPGPGLEAEVACFVVAIAAHGARLAVEGELFRTLKRAATLLWRRPERSEVVGFREVRLGLPILVGTALAVLALHL